MEKTRQIVARIVLEKSIYQEFLGHIAYGERGKWTKRTCGIVFIRRDAADDDTDADVNQSDSDVFLSWSTIP